MVEKTKKLLLRIKNSDDGKDFINFLEELSSENYKAMKLEGGDILRGKAIAFDYLLELFERSAVGRREAPNEWL